MNDDPPPPAGTDRADQGRGGRTGDIGLILGVAAVLVTVHFVVPPAIRQELALRHDRVTLHALVTSAYVHLDAAHLTGNLVGYLVGAFLVYGLAAEAGRGRWFRTVFVLSLTILPVVVNLVTLEIYAPPRGTTVVSQGFSAVVAGFGGASLVAVTGFLGRRYGRWTTLYSGGLLTLTVLGELLYLVADPVPTVWVGALGLGVVTAAGGLAGRWRRAGRPPTTDAWVRVLSDAAVVVGVGLVLSWFVLGLFPTQPLAVDRITNVVAHAVGGATGGAIGLVAYVLVPESAGAVTR